MSNIDFLIGTGEDIIKTERQGWYTNAIGVKTHMATNLGGGVRGEQSAADVGMAGSEKGSPSKGGRLLDG